MQEYGSPQPQNGEENCHLICKSVLVYIRMYMGAVVAHGRHGDERWLEEFHQQHQQTHQQTQADQWLATTLTVSSVVFIS